MGMKCIQCGADNLLADRTSNQGRCKQCNHPFAFEPTDKTNNKFAFTDPFFKKAIDDISSQNMLFFTPKQFLYFIDRRLKSRAERNRLAWAGFYLFGTAFFIIFVSSIVVGESLSHLFLVVVIGMYNVAWILGLLSYSRSPQQNIIFRKNSAFSLQILGVLILVIGISGSVFLSSLAGYATATLLGLTSFWLGFWQKRRQQGIKDEFFIGATQSEEWLQRWQLVNGNLEKLLPAPLQDALPASVDPEVSAYSFDRAIICDSDAIAQFLIANNVHFENNCAILSINDYPRNIFDTVIEMLRRNAELKMYALHGASPVGVSLVHQLRSNSAWFANQAVTILDLGLSPRQILANRNLFVQQSEQMAQAARQLPDPIRQSLTPAEIAWLEAGNFVELESLAPQRLLRVVNHGLAQTGDPQMADNFILVGDSGYGGAIFVSDSFG